MRANFMQSYNSDCPKSQSTGSHTPWNISCLAGPISSQTGLPKANLASPVFILVKCKTITRFLLSDSGFIFLHLFDGVLSNSSNNKLSLSSMSPSSSKPLSLIRIMIAHEAKALKKWSINNKIQIVVTLIFQWPVVTLLKWENICCKN